MTEYMEKKIEAFMSILIQLGLDADSVMGISSMMDNEDMMIEIVDRLEAKDFKVSPQETLNICGQVIEENLPEE